MAPQTPSTVPSVDSSSKGASAAASSAAAAAAAAAPIDESMIQVEDKLYSAEKLAAFHPGGDLFVGAFAGRDATAAFISYHRRKFPHDKVKDFLVGSRAPSYLPSFDKDYLELCEKVNQVLPRVKSFAPPSYYVKVLIIFASVFTLEAYIHYNRAYVWYLMAPLGFLFTMIGMNVQHDGNHGSISRNPTVNKLFGMSRNWIGHSMLDWVHEHVVQHHIDTNDLKTDPNIQGNFAIRFSPRKPVLRHQAFQYLYVFALYLLFGFLLALKALIHSLKFGNYTKFSHMLRKYQAADVLGLVLFHARISVAPILLSREPTLWRAFWNMVPVYVFFGYYVALFISLNHNFEGVHFFDRDMEDKSSASYLYAQTASSSNVGGAWLCTVNGGLNYQIEHHLFPGMHHSHYPRIAPMVREFCKMKGVPYVHFPTVWDNVRSTCAHLYALGKSDDHFKVG